MDYNNWRWTDLMPGDKIKTTVEAYSAYNWISRWSKSVLEVFRIEQCEDMFKLWIKHGAGSVYFTITENGCYYEGYISESRNIRLFDIVELIEDK
jgi:hypothetical protein